MDESGQDLEWHYHPQPHPARDLLREVKTVTARYSRLAADWNTDARPFRWVATADEIIEKVRAVTSRMAKLLGATEIGHVIPRPA